jgi:hypothetical protein
MHTEPIDVTAMEATFKCVKSNPHVHLQGSHWAALINAYCCVLNDTNKAIHVFRSIASHPASQRGPTPLPSAVSYESLINVLVTRKWMYLAQWYIARLQTMGIHVTVYIVNLLIKATLPTVPSRRLVSNSIQYAVTWYLLGWLVETLLDGSGSGSRDIFELRRLSSYM